MTFPIALDRYEPCVLDSNQSELSQDQQDHLSQNIQLARDAIIFFTAFANTKGLGGHTGGAYDIVPEILIADGLIKGGAPIYPVFYDEAGHRVAVQYLMAALNGFFPVEKLLHYREFGHGLYGHPERLDEAGIFFSSGRLGHMWSFINGVAAANPDKAVLMLGSEGSQQEGGDAEAARYAVAQKLNVKLLIDDNNVTIAGHPSDYMPGFDVAQTLSGHGLTVDADDGENLTLLYQRICQAVATPGPVALVNRRKMAVGVPGIEGVPKGHDVIPVNFAIEYLEARQLTEAVAMLKESAASSSPAASYQGSSPEKSKNRDNFGKFICDILDKTDDPKSKVLVVDSDLEGSCGLHHIRKNHPEVYVNAGIMERNNFSVAAGFGAEKGKQGIFGTFAAFMEMVISEITMARLNKANVLAHFSHSGVDDMADNTCHFGINNFFAANGLPQGDATRLYYPADGLQLKALLQRIFDDEGLRFVFTTRSAVPTLLTVEGNPVYGNGYTFTPGQDEVIRQGDAGWIVTYGEMVYRCLDVVETLRKRGINVGLINKATLNVVDEETISRVGKSPFVLVVETQNVNTGLGARFGSWLLERGLTPRFDRLGSFREGEGGLTEQIPHQGMSQEDILHKIEALMVL